MIGFSSLIRSCPRDVSRRVLSLRRAGRLFTSSTLLKEATTEAPSRPTTAVAPLVHDGKVVKIRPYPRASIERIGDFFGPTQQGTSFTGPCFSISLRPMPSTAAFDGRGAFTPPWLPLPVSPATHEKRHWATAPLSPPATLVKAVAPSVTAASSTDVKWESEGRSTLPAPPPSTTVRTIVFAGKKRVHKLAVYRHRCRTRIMAAFREAFRSRPGLAGLDGVWVLHAFPEAYASPMEEMVSQMTSAFARIGSANTGSAKKRGPPGDRQRGPSQGSGNARPNPQQATRRAAAPRSTPSPPEPRGRWSPNRGARTKQT